MVDYNKDDIKEVMEITGLDEVKAEKLFKEVAKDIDDGTDDELCSYDVIEVIKTEKNVKDTGADKNYTISETKKERKPRERKVDNEKALILDYLKKGLTLMTDSTTITTENEVKLHFPYNGSEYSVTLTKHRPKKG